MGCYIMERKIKWGGKYKNKTYEVNYLVIFFSYAVGEDVDFINFKYILVKYLLKVH